MLEAGPEFSDKLLPLRRFVVPGLYELGYLSILVQRKKLKARKIGRNYFTTRAWFDEYLDQHARDGKRDVYRKRRRQLDKKINGAEKSQISKLFNSRFFYRHKTALAGAAVFLLLMAGVIFLATREDKGQVAGVEEAGIGPFTGMERAGEGVQFGE